MSDYRVSFHLNSQVSTCPKILVKILYVETKILQIVTLVKSLLTRHTNGCISCTTRVFNTKIRHVWSITRFFTEAWNIEVFEKKSVKFNTYWLTRHTNGYNFCSTLVFNTETKHIWPITRSSTEIFDIEILEKFEVFDLY